MCKRMAAVIKSFMEQMIYFALYNSKLRLQKDKCAWLGGEFGLKPFLPHSQPHILLYTIVSESRLFLAKYFLTRPCGDLAVYFVRDWLD